MSAFSALSMCSSFMWVIHFVRGAQFLNALSVFASSPVAVITPAIRIYASE